MATFKLWRKHKIIIGKGHKKLIKVPSKGMYKLAKNNNAVIAERKAPSTIDLVDIRSLNTLTTLLHLSPALPFN